MGTPGADAARCPVLYLLGGAEKTKIGAASKPPTLTQEGKNPLKNGLGLEDIQYLCLCNTEISPSSFICTTAMFLDCEITSHMGLYPLWTPILSLLPSGPKAGYMT